MHALHGCSWNLNRNPWIPWSSKAPNAAQRRQRRRWELCLAFFQDLGNSSNIITFGAAISACAKGNRDQASNLGRLKKGRDGNTLDLGLCNVMCMCILYVQVRKRSAINYKQKQEKRRFHAMYSRGMSLKCPFPSFSICCCGLCLVSNWKCTSFAYMYIYNII